MESKGEFKIICLLTMLRGGSKLLHSLLDGHSQVITFPRTFQYTVFWKKIQNNILDHRLVADQFILDHPRFFSGNEWYKYNRYDKADRLGEEQNETFTVDADLFGKHFCALMAKSPCDRKNIFLNLNFAFHLATNKKIPKKGVILYHMKNFDYARKKYIERKTLGYRLGVYLFRLRLANPLPFLYFYPKRVYFMMHFLMHYRPDLDPPLFFDK